MQTPQLENFDAHSTAQNLESATTQSTKTPSSPDKTVQAGTGQAHRPLAAGDWLRAVLNFDAPFGHDGMPTVWG